MLDNYKKCDYVLDGINIRLHSFYGSSIVLSVLFVVGIIGMLGNSIDGLTESLYYFSSLSNPGYFVLLWSILPLEICFRFKTISKKLANIHHADPLIRIFNYMLLQTLAIGFGLIFGTVGLFANPEYEMYWPWMMSALLFSNACGILARGYIRDSPIINFLTTRIVSKFPRLGYLW